MENHWSRFRDKFRELESGCWEWTAYRLPNGYGRFWFRGTRMTAHRASYEMHHGVEIPKGMAACHSCDNRWCVNPRHIFPGTQQENVDDMYAKGRQRTDFSRAPRTITAAQAVNIKILLSLGATHRNVARWFGVTTGCTTSIKRGQTWLNPWDDVTSPHVTNGVTNGSSV